MTVRSVFAEANVRYHDEFGVLFLDKTYCALSDPVVIISLGREFVLMCGNAENKQSRNAAC